MLCDCYTISHAECKQGIESQTLLQFFRVNSFLLLRQNLWIWETISPLYKTMYLGIKKSKHTVPKYTVFARTGRLDIKYTKNQLRLMKYGTNGAPFSSSDLLPRDHAANSMASPPPPQTRLPESQGNHRMSSRDEFPITLVVHRVANP